MKDKKPILDYSSPALEKAHDQKIEDTRREGIENYNESTFGERRPYRNMLIRLALFGVAAVLVGGFLPRRVGRLVILSVFIIAFVWQVRRDGWEPPRSSLRHPFRWW